MNEKNMIADRYMVVTTLGSGGMADVFLAIDTILNREVAVKVLRGDSSNDPVALLRFQREASAVSKLHHPNVVEVYDIGEFDGRNYIVMEYIRGKTLKQLIRQRGALMKDEAVSIMKQLVAAVSHAHEKNIIHRDIKPQNVLVKDDGTIKITDFGIALAHDSVQLTQSDSVLGSAHYIAPETTKGESATVQIDIYALGVVFYELLTGMVPFNGDNPVQIAMKHMREDIPSVREFNPTIPQSIDNIIIRATAKNRVHRYLSAKDMAFDLDMCLMKEFENVDKVNFDDDEIDDGTVVFDNQFQEEKMDRGRSGKKVLENPAKKTKKKRNRKIAAIVVVIALLLSGATLGVYYSGLIDGFGPTEYVNIPSLEGLNEDQARDVLEELGLELDGKVDSEVTDEVNDGIIISQTPKAKRRVAKGSKIKITISSGNYLVIGDYIGKNLSEVEAIFENTNVKIKTTQRITSQAAPGTVLEQSNLNAGDKVTPNESKRIDLVVASSPEFVLEDYKGAIVKTAQTSLESLGATVVTYPMSVEDLPEDQREGIERGTVVRQTPAPNSYYIQQGNNVVTLFYYE